MYSIWILSTSKNGRFAIKCSILRQICSILPGVKVFEGAEHKYILEITIGHTWNSTDGWPDVQTNPRLTTKAIIDSMNDVRIHSCRHNPIYQFWNMKCKVVNNAKVGQFGLSRHQFKKTPTNRQTYRQTGWHGTCGANRVRVPQPREMQMICLFQDGQNMKLVLE